MSDTSERSSAGGVLRPFVEPEMRPLPDEDTEPAPRPDSSPPFEPPSPEASTAVVERPLPPPETDELADPVEPEPLPVETEAPTPDADDPADEAGFAAIRTAGGHDASSDEFFSDLDEQSEPRTVTLGRTPFMIGLGTIAVVLVLLLVLWQNAGGDGEPTAEVAVESPPPVDTDGVVVDTTDIDALNAALADQTARADGAEQRATELESQVAELQGQLAEQPIPALPASALQRIIVSTDAQFLSATDASVAVVGPFGGYANIDPSTNAVTASGQISTEATRVLRTPTTVWATNFSGNEILRLDPVTNEIVGSIPFPGPDGLAKEDNVLLVASFSEGFVARVDPNAGTISQQVDVGGSATGLAVAEAYIYAAVFETGEVVKIDRATFEVVDRIIVGAGPVGIIAGDGDRAWVSNRNEGTVVRVDFETGEVISVEVGPGPVELAAAFGSLWVAVADAGELVQIDPADQTVVTRTPLGGSPTGVSVAAGSVWVGVSGDRSVVRVTLG